MRKRNGKVRTLIVTVAGMSTRFGRSLGRDCLKCIYSPDGVEQTLLWRMLHQPAEFDRYVIVGGYRFPELERTIHDAFRSLADRILLIENKSYAEYGSGYSLYLGLRKALDIGSDEVVFAEGDLFVDGDTFRRVAEDPRSVVTVSPEPILANRAVVFYFDAQERIHYLYDTGHSMLEIREPFTAVYNSGQIWKFADSRLLASVFQTLPEESWRGTNLVMVEPYFRQMAKEDYEIISFKKWINCNTVEDFERIKEVDEP